MAGKSINRKLNIYINGKEVKNNLFSIGKEMAKLRGQVKHLTRGSEAYNAKSKELRAVTKRWRDMRQEITGTTGSLKQGAKGMGSFVKAFAGGFTIGTIITSVGSFLKNSISDSIRLAEEARGVNYAFEQIEGSAKLLERTREASKGLISDLEIKKAANSFNAFKLDLEPFPELLQFVSTRAAQTGGNFDNMLNSLVEGLSKESKLRIDNLGISQKELNDELEKTPDFVQAVANIASRELEGAGGILDEAASANQKWNVALENSKLRIGELAQKSGITSFFQNVGTNFLNNIAPVENLTKSFEDQAQKVINLENEMPGLIDEYESLKSQTTLNVGQQDRLKTVIERIGNITPTAITAFDEYGRALDISADSAREFIGTQKALLGFRNKEALEEQTETLDDYKNKIEELQNQLEAGGKKILVRGSRGKQFKVFSDEEIKEVQVRLGKLQNLQTGALESVNQLSGDYLDKYVQRQKDKTAATLKEAKAQADALKIPYSPEATAEEINALIAKHEAKSEILEKNRKKEKLVREREEAFRNKILFENKNEVEKEKELHQKRLEDSGVYGVAKERLTMQQLKVLEILETNHKSNLEKIEKEHVAKVANLDAKATQDYYAVKQKEYKQNLLGLKTSQQNELASITDLGEAKKILSTTLGNEELNKITTLEEAKKALNNHYQTEQLEEQEKFLNEMLFNLESALRGETVEGLSLGDNLLSEEERVVLEERLTSIRFLMSEIGLKKQELTSTDETGESTAPNLDILGFNPEQWEATFKNKDKLVGKLQRTAMVLNTVGQAWGMYSKFAAAAEQKQLQKLEQSTKRKKDLLKDQLDAGIIDQDTYNKKVEKLDQLLAKKKAEIELKQAKRERIGALFSIASSTATGIVKAVAASPLTGGLPWTAIIAALGAAQAAMVLSQPLPSASYADGGFTDGLGFNDKDGEVAGVVHSNEYVIPQAVLTSNDPAIPAVVEYLEAKRQGKPGSFAEGGPTTQPEASEIGDREDANYMGLLVETMNQLNAMLQNGITTGPIAIGDNDIRDLEDRKIELDDVRENAKIK